MLNIKDFTPALEIISKSHSTELAINIPKNNFVGNMGQTEFRIIYNLSSELRNAYKQ